MSLELRPYRDEDAPQWDAFCALSANGTFLHTRRFLSYHGSRFEDASVVVEDDKGLVGLLPAALSREEPGLVVSHPGATFGAWVHDGRLHGAQMLEAFAQLGEHYLARGLKKLSYKCVPGIYQKSPSQDDLYALFRLKAQRSVCGLSSSIDLAQPRRYGSRRLRGQKKAAKETTAIEGPEALPELWAVLSENLEQKHQARPVHSLQEIQLLQSLFPGEIKVKAAKVGNELVAGVVLFCSGPVWHAQYIAANSRGYEASALDGVFARCIEEAAAAGARYFDFGTSNESGGWILNESLYQFKSEFGGGGTAYEHYALDLTV